MRERKEADVGDFIIKTNDMLQVTVPPPAVVPPLAAPIPLIGSGTTVTIGGVPVCLQGDEAPPSVKVPLPYTSPPFVTPGMGTLTIMLLPTNLSQKTVQGKPMLLKGQTFNATFDVQSPAMQPTPAGPVPDPVMSKPCTCQFITTNVNTQAG
jgi:Contractile injection system spike tip protein